jgi:hypothetical protein
MNTYGFTVSFDAASDPKTVSVEGTPEFPISVHQGISLITFALDPASGAEFPSTPIQWMNNGEPTTLPSWFVMHWHDAHHFALWDFNSAPVATQHQFVVSVYYQGQFYSSHDPTIINEPPIQT